MKYLVFSKNILLEYDSIKRDLPWRASYDPYKIWVSEIILQQTRIDQGMGYYYRFLEKFPNINSLASASEEDVLKIWQGLGYYSRARNLHATAKEIAFEMNGVFPSAYAELKKLKGIGDYTAAAIASICFNEPVAAIDGNAFRVLSRYFGIETPVNSTEGKKTFRELAAKIIDRQNPGTFNQAIMDFGSLKCTPRNPLCSDCSLQNSCLAFNQNLTGSLPVKSKKNTVRDRFFNYIVYEHDNSLLFKKRTGNDIWKNLYDFPLIETAHSTTIEELPNTKEWNNFFSNEVVTIEHVSKEIVHVLSHQKIHARFFHVKCKTEKNLFPQFYLINKLNIFEIPIPKIIENYIEKMAFINQNLQFNIEKHGIQQNS